MRTCILLVLIVFLLLPTALVGQIVPDVSAGLLALNNEMIFWTPSNLYRRPLNDFTAKADVVSSLSGSIPKTLDAIPNLAGDEALLWTALNVFKYLNLGSLQEVFLQDDFAPIRGARLAVSAPSLSGEQYVLCTASRILRLLSNQILAEEITTFGMESIPDVQIIEYADNQVLFSTPERLYFYAPDSINPLALEVTSAGQSIAEVREILRVETVSSIEYWIRTETRIFQLPVSSIAADEVLLSTGAQLSDIEAMVFDGNAGVLMWRDATLFLALVPGFPPQVQILSTFGSPIRGLTRTAQTTALFLVWTAHDLFRMTSYVDPPQLLMDSNANQLVGVLGIVMRGFEALIYTADRVYSYFPGQLFSIPTEQDVTPFAPGSISGLIRLPNAVEDIFWKPTALYVRQGFGTSFQRLEPGGGPFSTILSALRIGEETIIMTSDRVWAYHLTVSGPVLVEVVETASESSIPILDSSLGLVSTFSVVQYVDSQQDGFGACPLFFTPVVSTGTASSSGGVGSLGAISQSATLIRALPSNESTAILGPRPVSGIVSGSSVRIFGVVFTPRLRGNVNAGRGAVTDVLFVNGSAGDLNSFVTVGTNSPITIDLLAPPEGPAPARYVLWIWEGGLFNPPVALNAGPVDIGVLANPTPIHTAPNGSPLQPQPSFCLRSQGIPDALCGGVTELSPPAASQTPWTLAFPGVATPGSFVLQAAIQDDGAGNERLFSVTNGIKLIVQ